MSCLGKCFVTILNNRLVLYLTNQGKNSKCQIGFSKDCRTSDHILTIKTLIDKYTQENKKLYTCFIDFKKAFDTVWRNGLFYKLLKRGIGGNFARLLENMYSKATVSVKLPGGTTEYFTSTLGVKQGCVLSPTLFKLFVNDMPDIFDHSCSPAKLYHENINCLLFADDVILVSETPEGLQHALDKLMDYCQQWLLEVNPEKTKVMIFNKSGKKIISNKFYLQGNSLELVNSCTYLGIELSTSGSMSKAIQNLTAKATKAMYKLRNSIFKTAIIPKMALRLFDTLIRPIATYGAEVWGACINDIPKVFDIRNDKYNCDKMSFEKLDLKFCKSILGVHGKASNIGTRGELGRYPITIHIVKLFIKNWLRITNYDKTSLLYDAYLCNLDMMSNNKQCWLTNIYDIVYKKLGATHIWENQGTQGKNTVPVKTFVCNLKHIFNFQWKNALNKETPDNTNEGNKMRTYLKFKKELRYEEYLDYNPDFRIRRNITKLRISAHKLEIEAGRYKMKNKKKIPAQERVCHTCKVMEDEQHLILNCTEFDSLRKKMLDKLTEIFVNFNTYTDEEKFIFIMKVTDYEMFSVLGDFLSQVEKARGRF